MPSSVNQIDESITPTTPPPRRAQSPPWAPSRQADFANDLASPTPRQLDALALEPPMMQLDGMLYIMHKKNKIPKSQNVECKELHHI
jgi:hypothetical protein